MGTQALQVIENINYSFDCHTGVAGSSLVRAAILFMLSLEKLNLPNFGFYDAVLLESFCAGSALACSRTSLIKINRKRVFLFFVIYIGIRSSRSENSASAQASLLVQRIIASRR